jgi:hypothetical protein
MHMGSNERGAYYDKTGKGQRYLSDAVVDEQKNWPTVRASEYKDVGPVGSKSHDHMLGKHYLCAVVTQDAANWPTASMSMTAGYSERDNCNSSKKAGHVGNELLRQVIKHGQAAPASSNSLGSRQGLWLTPRANEPDSDPNFAARNADRGAHCHGTLSSQAKSEQWATPSTADTNRMWKPETLERRKAEGKVAQMGLNYQAVKLWPTITAHTPDMESNGPNGHQGTYLAGAVKQWATPRSGKTTDENPETWALRQAKGDVATMPLGAQVKMWPTASVPNGGQTTSGRADKDAKKQVRLEHAVAQWGTPAANDANKTPHCEVNSNQAGLAKSVGLELQRQWGTPTARDHKSGRGNEEREYKELTPMVERQQSGKLNPRWVETLMGLPIGWTMPSCTSPQTIAPMSCDSSAMESCQPPQSELSEFSLASWPSPRAGESQQTEELSRLWVENGFKQPKTRGGKARANGSTFDVTLETAARGVAAMEAKP